MYSHIAFLTGAVTIQACYVRLGEKANDVMYNKLQVGI
jgi:hypothetical protein